jgi:hypothetical protein
MHLSLLCSELIVLSGAKDPDSTYDGVLEELNGSIGLVWTDALLPQERLRIDYHGKSMNGTVLESKCSGIGFLSKIVLFETTSLALSQQKIRGLAVPEGERFAS